MTTKETIIREVVDEFEAYPRTKEEWDGEYMSNKTAIEFITSTLHKVYDAAQKERV